MEKKKIRFVKSDNPWTRGRMVIKYGDITYGENNLFTIAVTVIGLMIIFPIVFFVTPNSSGANYSSWSGTFRSARSFPDSWVISARTLNGHTVRTLYLDNENLNALHVSSANEEGGVYLVISQIVDAKESNESGEVFVLVGRGEIGKTIYLSDRFDEYIDMQDFSSGRVRLQLRFDRARGVNTTVSWG